MDRSRTSEFLIVAYVTSAARPSQLLGCGMDLIMKAFIIVVTSLVLFGGDVELARTQRQTDRALFFLHLPRTIDTTYLSVKYFLTGSFGGHGGFLPTKPNTWDYAIETSYENKPARTLKAIIFCPGYEMKLVNVPSLDHSSVGDAIIELEPLPSIRLSGRVMLPKRDGVADLNIEATYLAYWGHEFFGIADGMVSAFFVASTRVSEDGSFSTTIPDFAHDSSINFFKQKGVIRLSLREPNTGNMPYRLERANNSGRDVEIGIGAEYGSDLILYARTRN
jgi:hypothetical protein